MKSLAFNHKRIFAVVFFSLGIICMISCKKFIEIDPPNNQLASETVFSSEATATAAISAIYSEMVGGIGGFANGGLGSVGHLAGMSADEFINYQSHDEDVEIYQNSLEPFNTELLTNLWGPAYHYIYSSNSILEGIENSSSISIGVKNQIKGEAKFIRGLCYFYIVNLFGDVPLIMTTDYSINSKIGRTGSGIVYQQILTDLLEAQLLLADDYASGIERVRPNKSAATALLARVYLYAGDYFNAEIQASSVINNTSKYSLAGLSDVFLAGSSEAIWQLKPVRPEINTQEGNSFILEDIPANVSLSEQLYNSFEPGDLRKLYWIRDTSIQSNLYHYPFKYKIKTGNNLTEYSIVLRLAEQYLIRAEARTHLNKLSEAQQDLNLIRNRAGLPNTTAATQAELLVAILHERRVELFTEWGHRWLDLKRSGTIDAVMVNETPLKGGVWDTNQQLYPIPQTEIDKNGALDQNAGY